MALALLLRGLALANPRIRPDEPWRDSRSHCTGAAESDRDDSLRCTGAGALAWRPNATEERRWRRLVPGGCTFDVVDAAELTAARFEQRYYGRRPLKIVNAGAGGAARRRLERQRLRDDFAELRVKSASYADGGEFLPAGRGKRESALGAYLDELRAGKAGVLFAREGRSTQGLWARGPFATMARAWARALPPSLAAFTAAPADLSLSVGSNTLGANGLHWHSHQEALLQLMHGTKYWALMPAFRTPPGGIGVTSHNEWHATRYAAFQKAGGEAHVQRCIQEPGDIVYAPEHWEHAIVNLGETIALGLQKRTFHTTLAQSFAAAHRRFTALMQLPEPTFAEYDAAIAAYAPLVREHGGPMSHHLQSVLESALLATYLALKFKRERAGNEADAVIAVALTQLRRARDLNPLGPDTTYLLGSTLARVFPRSAESLDEAAALLLEALELTNNDVATEPLTSTIIGELRSVRSKRMSAY